MWRYSLQLALRSIRKQWQLSSLMVLALAIGIGILMMVQTQSYHSTKPPLAHKAERIWSVQLDARGVDSSDITFFRSWPDLTYFDAEQLILLSGEAKGHALAWRSYNVLSTESHGVRPYFSESVVTSRDFFRMFESRFIYGAPWSAEADQQGAPVIVLNEKSNQALFGGKNSVGLQVSIGGHATTVVGVVASMPDTRPFYLGSFWMTDPNTSFVPHSFAVKQNLPRSMNLICHNKDIAKRGSYAVQDIEGLKSAECGFIRLWLEFDNLEQQMQFRDKLANYVVAQRSLGRLTRDEVTYFTSLRELTAFWNEAYGGAMTVIAPLFFGVCLLNAIGLLLAKFVRNGYEVSLRRALGASKKMLFAQYITEVLLIGLLGALLGLAFSYVFLQGLIWQNQYAVDFEVSAQTVAANFALNWQLGLQAIGIALSTSLVLGLYPIWQMCSKPVAPQLKSQ
ncbi:ABC transporter permease [Pseudoalteromonas fenneropenaei]|uniref:ABC transporter permease n=1 Tax=Pseudoalteromonas fenneropenaei TaxID=1737459 RepID=A0ABV7CET0_9GAMM